MDYYLPQRHEEGKHRLQLVHPSYVRSRSELQRIVQLLGMRYGNISSGSVCSAKVETGL